MLKESQPQLCIKCHAEMKGPVPQTFHHKVLEGVIKCSDATIARRFSRSEHGWRPAPMHV